MAFIFQADRKGPIDLSKATNPGPGEYVSHQAYKGNKGYAPFLSTVERDTSKKQKETVPGPGSYDVLVVENALKVTKPFHAMLNPEKEGPEINAYSTPFKSKTRRFEYKIDTDQPGPGAYINDSAFTKAASTNAIQSKSYTGFPIQKLTKENRTVIPSIPSYMHSYGYSEADTRKLMLNKNPLIEIQQFVGPGYYDTKDTFQGEAQKGTTWHRSKVRRFDSQDSKLSTKNVGPGSYDVLKLDGAMPLYKEKESSGFASRTGRSEISNAKPKNIQNKIPKTGNNINFELNAGANGNVIVERHNEDERYTEESVPGPGYYHSENLATSLKMNYKPTKLQFFGSGSERFKEEQVASQQLGPGEYNVPEEIFKNKNKPKVGFQSTEPRIKSTNPSELGPGVYELKTNIVDRVYDKAKRGYLGSFGSTELRFKPKRIPEETPEQIEYYQREYQSANTDSTANMKKTSHYFVSNTNRNQGNAKKPEQPCPGSYDVNHFDMSKKITQNDSAFYTNKKVPFSSTENRFKWSNKSETKGNKQGDDLQDEHSAWKRNITIKHDVPNKSSSVFSSKTQRAASCMPRNGLPGPGSYHNTKQQDGWVKKTYNIKFLEN